MKRVETIREILVDQARFLMLGLSATAGLMPLAFLFVSGLGRVVGVVYALVWLLVCVPSTFAYFAFLGDIWRLYRMRRPVHLVGAMVEAAIRIDQPTVARTHRIHWFVELSCRLNPLTTLVLSLFGQAISWRAEFLFALWNEARRSIAPRKAKPVEFPTPTHSAEFGAQIVEPWVRDKRWEGALAHA